MIYLQRIKKLYVEPKPDDFVFAHRDGQPIHSMKKSFIFLIDNCGVGFDNKGNRRTLYSLRHTYSTFRFDEGTDIHTLARNMGTSISMVEIFYAQTRTPDQVSELTKMRSGNISGGNIFDVLDKTNYL